MELEPLEPLKPLNDNTSSHNSYSDTDYNSNFNTADDFIEIDKTNDTDTLDKDTNYVFFFGIGQSGKSAILSTMLYHISTKEGVLRPNRKAKNSQEAKLLLENFRSNIRKGILPNRTTKGEVNRLNFTFEPNNKSDKVRPINITFLEIAGEDLTAIRRGGSYADHIAKYLKADIPITFIIVTSYDNAHNDDTIINQFLEEIEYYGKDPKLLNMILVISKWDKSGRIEPRVGTNSHELEDFIDERLPMTSQYLDTFSFDRTHYTAGIIHNEEGYEKIARLNLKSAENLSHWLYESIVGYPLDYEGTLWERIKWGITGK